MKIEDVPQDSKYLKHTIIRDVAYAIDNDGNYVPVISEGWEVKNSAIDITWESIDERCEEIREEVLAGKLSPLAYHLEKHIMDVGLLAKYMGFTKRTVKKHLNPESFKELNNSILQQYADVLCISIEELKKV